MDKKNRNRVSILDAPSRLHGAPALIVRGDSVSRREELLTGEEPLQIRAAGPEQEPRDVAITMRTPGAERALAIGFLVSEGLVSASDAPDASFEFGDPAVIAQPEDEILVRLPKSLDLSSLAERHFVATASCGICGRATLDELMARVEPMPSGPVIARSALELMPETMRAAQVAFAQTGGIHAAALFSVSGDLIELHEDVGRHNALDKVVGSQALAGRLPLHDSLLLVSGRVSFEIVQKAATAGIPILAAVSAPSDLAVETAERLGMTVIGFLRGNGFNVYTGEERIALDGCRT
jgi:FdhD protein